MFFDRPYSGEKYPKNRFFMLENQNVMIKDELAGKFQKKKD